MYRLAPVQNVCKPKKENIYPLTIPLSANGNLCFAESWLTGRHEFSPRTYASSRSFSRRNLTRVNVSTVRLEADPIQYLPCAYLTTVNITINTYKVTVVSHLFSFLHFVLFCVVRKELLRKTSQIPFRWRVKQLDFTWHWRRTQGSAALCHLKELL